MQPNSQPCNPGVRFLKIIMWSLCMDVNKTKLRANDAFWRASSTQLAALAETFQCYGFLLLLLMIQILLEDRRQLVVQSTNLM